MRSGTGTSTPDNSTDPSSMRCLGWNSAPAGWNVAAWMASRPTSSVLPSTQTADGSNGDPSNNTVRVRPSARTRLAAVLDVPKSTPSTTSPDRMGHGIRIRLMFRSPGEHRSLTRGTAGRSVRVRT